MSRFQIRLLCAALGLVVGACVSDENCVEPSGLYVVRYFEDAGTCGDLPDQTLSFDGQPKDPSFPCRGQFEHSESNCETLLIEYQCPEQQLGDRVTSTLEGKIRWGDDGNRGEALVQYVVRNAFGHVLCWSTYEAEYDRM